MRRSESERGFALILTLVVTALLIAVTTEFIHGVYVDTSLHRNFVNLQQASLMAEGGVTGGISLLRNLRTSANDQGLQQLLADPVRFEDEKGRVGITIEEEDGKLNLNAVTLPNGDEHVFYGPAERRLLTVLKLPLALHDSLADWLDANDEPRPDGGESAYYQSLSAPYAPRNAPFATFGELGLVRGVEPAVLERLRPFATVFVDGGAINVNTAPLQVLMALDEGISEGIARDIMQRRRIKPFKNVGELSEIPGMETIAGKLSGFAGVRGSTYRLVSRAAVGDVTRLVEAVVNLDGTQPRYLYWREY